MEVSKSGLYPHPCSDVDGLNRNPTTDKNITQPRGKQSDFESCLVAAITKNEQSSGPVQKKESAGANSKLPTYSAHPEQFSIDNLTMRRNISQNTAEAYADPNSIYVEDFGDFFKYAPKEKADSVLGLFEKAGFKKSDILAYFNNDWMDAGGGYIKPADGREAISIDSKVLEGNFPKQGKQKIYIDFFQIVTGPTRLTNEDGETVRAVKGTAPFQIVNQELNSPENHAAFEQARKQVYEWSASSGRIAAVQANMALEEQIKLLKDTFVVLTDKDGKTWTSETGHYYVPPGKYTLSVASKNPELDLSKLVVSLDKTQHVLNSSPSSSASGSSLEVTLEAGSKDVLARRPHWLGFILPGKWSYLRNEKMDAPQDYSVKVGVGGEENKGCVVVTVVPKDYIDYASGNGGAGLLYLLNFGRVKETTNNFVSPGINSTHGASGGDGATPH